MVTVAEEIRDIIRILSHPKNDSPVVWKEQPTMQKARILKGQTTIPHLRINIFSSLFSNFIYFRSRIFSLECQIQAYSGTRNVKRSKSICLFSKCQIWSSSLRGRRFGCGRRVVEVARHWRNGSWSRAAHLVLLRGWARMLTFTMST